MMSTYILSLKCMRTESRNQVVCVDATQRVIRHAMPWHCTQPRIHSAGIVSSPHMLVSSCALSLELRIFLQHSCIKPSVKQCEKAAQYHIVAMCGCACRASKLTVLPPQGPPVRTTRTTRGSPSVAAVVVTPLDSTCFAILEIARLAVQSLSSSCIQSNLQGSHSRFCGTYGASTVPVVCTPRTWYSATHVHVPTNTNGPCKWDIFQLLLARQLGVFLLEHLESQKSNL